MLNTFTSPPPRRRRETPPKRSVGGQPGNANARKHGFYARRDPSPIVEQLIHIKSLRQSALLASRAGQLQLLQFHVQTLQELLYENFLRAGDSHLDSHTILHIDRFFRSVSATLRAKRALKKLLDELDFLPSLARHALPLCTAEFTDRRISPYAYYGQANELFDPHLLRKNRALTSGHSQSTQPSVGASAPSPCQCEGLDEGESPGSQNFFHLTTSQWALLEPAMTSLRGQLAEMGIRQRQRTFSDRFLLESILTRLAFGLRWDDLRGQVPVRACQMLYKQLCTSGRMRLIYELLHQHLLAEGGISLAEMTADGTFAHTGDRIFLTGEQPLTWQRLAALLLLQRALYNRRRLQRAETQARRRRGGYQREPSISRSSRRRRANRPRRPSPAAQPFPGLVPIADCFSTSPLLSDKLGSVSSDLKSRSP